MPTIRQLLQAQGCWNNLPPEAQRTINLVDLILTQNPYGAAHDIGQNKNVNNQKPPAQNGPLPAGNMPAAQAASPGITFELDGPAAGYWDNGGNTLSCANLGQMYDKPQEGYWWYFDDKMRFVSKALRVPFYYNQCGAERKDFFLIGYEGMGW